MSPVQHFPEDNPGVDLVGSKHQQNLKSGLIVCVYAISAFNLLQQYPAYRQLLKILACHCFFF